MLYFRHRSSLSCIVAGFEGHKLALSTLCALVDQKNGVAVHLLGVVFKDFDRVTELSNGGEDIDRHGLRARPRLFWIKAFLSRPWTRVTKMARVHEQQKGLVVTGKKDFSLQLQEL